MKQTKTSSILILIALILFVGLFVFFMYTFLHEGGHAITGLLFGQSLTEFDVSFWDFSAHVGMIGGELTESQLAVQAVAGAFLPLLLWTIFISLVPRKGNFTLETLKLISSMAVVNTLLAWIVLPILFLLGKAPSDDVINFLRYSQMPPLTLTCIAFFFYIGGWILFLSKIDGLRNELLLFSTIDQEKFATGTRRTILLMTSLLMLCILSAVVLNSSADRNSLNKFTPPQDFAPVAQIDLSTRAYSTEILTTFLVNKPAYVGVFIAIRGINTTYFDLRVIGPDGYASTVMHGESYSAFQDGGLWEESLAPGEYQIVLTSHQSPGTASVYLKTH
jgi:hypothetical protein